MNYVLITPAKNEEEFLPIVADSVIKQSLLPALWVIVDDGSTDKTPEIIEDLKNKYEWIHSIKLSEGERDLTFRVSFVYRSGFRYCIDYCSEHKIKYDLLGVLDADTQIYSDYFSDLIDEFKKDQRLGIASGMIIDPITQKNERPDYDFEPMGTGRLITVRCYNDVGGYPHEPFADSITNVKAKLRGWKIAQFHHIKAAHLRKTNTAEGLWKGQMMYGRYAHYFNKNPILVILTVISLSVKRPFYPGLAFMIGYIKAIAKKEKKINDKEIRDYYWNERLKEYIK